MKEEKLPIRIALSKFVGLFDVVLYILGSSRLGELSGDRDDLKKALVPIWQPEHPKLWWPPSSTLDGFGGIDGLAKALATTGLPTLVQGHGPSAT